MCTVNQTGRRLQRYGGTYQSRNGYVDQVKTSVIVVNYNGRSLLEDCLDGLEAQVRPADEVIVVDNGSTDGSSELIHSRYPWIKLIETGENLGFARGNNVGIRVSSGDIVVLLNNDTVPSPAFIERIVGPIEKNPSIGAVAGTMLFSNDPSRVASAGIDVFRNGLALDVSAGCDWRDLPEDQEVFGASGGAAAIRRDVLNDVGLFAEPFFLYLEDADLAWRMRLRGHHTATSSGAWVHHVYSASAGEGSPLKDYYLSRNRIWTLIRCWPRPLWTAFWSRVLVYEIGVIGYAVLDRRLSILRGRIDSLRAFRRLWRSRRTVQSRRTSSTEELLYWMKPNPSVRDIFEGRRLIRSMLRSSR
jgi:GT2 family glycosyltransferase